MDALHTKLQGLETTFTVLVEQVSSALRKELQSTTERLERRIDSDAKDQAAELHKAKCGMTLQSSEDVKAAEDRLIRRMDSERREHKEAIAELRREITSQLVAREKQDTASFATQRVVPKENEEVSALRKKMEEIQAMTGNSQQDMMRLATDLAEQRRRIDCMDQAMNKHFSKHTDEMFAVRTAAERAEKMAQVLQAKVAEDRGGSAMNQEEVQKLVTHIMADVVEELRGELQVEFKEGLRKAQSELREVSQTSSRMQEELKETTYQMKGSLKQMEDSRLELRLGALESAAKRAATYSDAGEGTLFSAVHSRRDKQVEKASVLDTVPLTREEPRPRLDPRLDDLMLLSEKKGEIQEVREREPLVPPDLKNRLENLVEQVKETLSYSNSQINSIFEKQDIEGQLPNGHDEPLEQYAPQGYVEDGYFANGHEYPNSQPDYIQGQPEMYYEPQLENQVPYGYENQAYMVPQYMAPMPQAPMPMMQTPTPHHPYPQMQPVPQSHARYCGSIALPISREPEHYSEQDHAASEYGLQQQPDYGLMGSLDGEGLVGEGGYDVFESPGQFIDMPQVPYAHVSLGPPQFVGVGPPVVHSVTTRVGRPMSPLREQSPLRGRGASPVRAASPLRTPGQPRHRELSPFRARSIGDPPSFSFQSGFAPNVAMSPVPVSVVTGAPAVQAQLPQAQAHKKAPPKEDEESDSSDEENQNTGLFGRMFRSK